MKNKITPWDILNYSLQNIFCKCIEVDIAGVQKSEETIANFQWFLRRPSPLNVFGRSDHCHQWFYDGFLMLLPSLSMVFDGSGPLVKRCDGFDGSSWSRPNCQMCPLKQDLAPTMIAVIVILWNLWPLFALGPGCYGRSSLLLLAPSGALISTVRCS